MTRLLVALIFAAAVGALAAWHLKPEPAPRYRTVIVADEVLEAERPKVAPGLGERITTRRVEPEQVATSAGTPDTAIVRRFWERIAAGRRPPVKGEITELRNPEISPPPPILPPFAGRYDGRELELHATRSDGSLYLGTFRVKPGFTWVAGRGGESDTAALVREERAILRGLRNAARDCPKGGAIGAAAGLGLGLLLGDVAAGTAGGAAAGCLAAAAF